MTPQDASLIAARKLFPASEGYNNVDKQAAIILSVFAPLLALQNPSDKEMLDKVATDKAAANKIAADKLAAFGKHWDELGRAYQELEKHLEGRK
jgi:hypothetical protein